MFASLTRVLLPTPLINNTGMSLLQPYLMPCQFNESRMTAGLHIMQYICQRLSSILDSFGRSGGLIPPSPFVCLLWNMERLADLMK